MTRCGKIAIVGAGFTGTLLAVHTLLRLHEPAEILLFDQRNAFGRGLAYATRNPRHLLNVRAADMSAFEDDPQHFVRWLRSRGAALDRTSAAPPSGEDFVPRAVYGAYLEELLRAAMRDRLGMATVSRIGRNVVAIDETGDGAALTLDDGSTTGADRVVLCLGNFPPSPCLRMNRGIAAADRCIADPWNGGAIHRVGPDDSLLLVGTGLTMIDMLMELAADRHRGPIVAVSRHGLLPRVHGEMRGRPASIKVTDLPGALLPLLRRVRAEAARAEASGQGWRSVMDAIRPMAQVLWRALSPDDRARFLRHLRPYWDAHRHRMAPQIAREIGIMRDSGRLTVMAGRVEGADAIDGRLAVAVRPRGESAATRMTVDWVVNCTGPEANYRRVRHPLIRHLLNRGLARPDDLALGLDVTARFAIVAEDGLPSPWLSALGPPTRGRFWECTAVPDIRKQCARMATMLAHDFARRNIVGHRPATSRGNPLFG